MAKEYITNNEKNETEGINWNKIEITVQHRQRDLNTADAKSVVDYELFCDYYGYQIGYLHFSVYKDVIAKKIHHLLPAKNFSNFIYINNVLVQIDFRGWGVGQALYNKFGELYTEHFEGYCVSQIFINPIAEYAFRKEVYKGHIPDSVLEEGLIVRQYDENEKNKLKELYKWLPKSEQEKLDQQLKLLKIVDDKRIKGI